MTIKEMAEKEFPIICWEERRAGHACRELYCKGAIAILEEFEKIMAMNYDEETTYGLIENKIKELKGE